MDTWDKSAKFDNAIVQIPDMVIDVCNGVTRLASIGQKKGLFVPLHMQYDHRVWSSVITEIYVAIINDCVFTRISRSIDS